MEDKKEKTLDGIVLKCPICSSALETNIYDNGKMSITCGSGKRCINLASYDHARLFDLLRNEDWRTIAEEVKSCPKCGGDEIEIWFDYERYWIHCQHPRCWDRAVARGETLEEVLAQWKELVANVDAVKGIERNGEEMEDYHFKCGPLRIRYRALACPDCHQPPAVTFDPSRQEFKISCCGYSLENENLAVVFESWNDFVQEKIEEMEEKTPSVNIAPCPKCGEIPEIHDVSDLYDDEYLISCCGVSKCLDGYLATIEAWNDYSAENQLKTPAERSQDKISEVIENLREMLISKNQNYGNSAFTPPVLCPKMDPEKALLVRMSDKVARLASLASGEKDRVGESMEDTLYDLAGYCILAIIAMRKE